MLYSVSTLTLTAVIIKIYHWENASCAITSSREHVNANIWNNKMVAWPAGSEGCCARGLWIESQESTHYCSNALYFESIVLTRSSLSDAIKWYIVLHCINHILPETFWGRTVVLLCHLLPTWLLVSLSLLCMLSKLCFSLNHVVTVKEKEDQIINHDISWNWFIWKSLFNN